MTTLLRNETYLEFGVDQWVQLHTLQVDTDICDGAKKKTLKSNQDWNVDLLKTEIPKY